MRLDKDYRIYKYQLKLVDFQTVKIKGLHRIISVGLDPAGELCLWAIVDANNENLTYAKALIIGTGNPFYPDILADDEQGLPVNKFLGTVTQGVFVWHVFVSP